MSYVLFPYERIQKGSRVILYGMGWLGKMFVEQIAQNHYCELLFAVDRDYQSKSSNLIAVKPPVAIMEAEYDYVVISLLSVSMAESVKDDLAELGVPAEQCIYKYALLEADRENVLQKVTSMENFLRNRIGKILYGLESFAENECWRRSCKDWEHSWLNAKFRQLQTALMV